MNGLKTLWQEFQSWQYVIIRKALWKDIPSSPPAKYQMFLEDFSQGLSLIKLDPLSSFFNPTVTRKTEPIGFKEITDPMIWNFSNFLTTNWWPNQRLSLSIRDFSAIGLPSSSFNRRGLRLIHLLPRILLPIIEKERKRHRKEEE